MEDPMRSTGFQRPFHPFQIASWVVFGLDVLIYLVCVFSLIDHDAKLALAPCYIASVVALVVATAKATSTDAVDPHVLVAQHSDGSLERDEDAESMPFCGICNCFVNARSKHCRVCNKCVDVFDHHCMWINNCIGQANYRSFFCTISSVAVMIGFILCTTAYLLFTYFDDPEVFEMRLQDTPVVGDVPRELFLVLLLFMVAINGPLFLLDGQLVVLHSFLMMQGMTTYEYIVNKRSGLERRGEPESSDKYALGSEKRKGRSVRSLPNCMDWIVFSKCGRRRRRSSAKGGHGAESRVGGSDAQAGPGAGTEEGPPGAGDVALDDEKPGKAQDTAAGAKLSSSTFGYPVCDAGVSAGATPCKIGLGTQVDGDEEDPGAWADKKASRSAAIRAPNTAGAADMAPLPLAAAAAAVATATPVPSASPARGSPTPSAGASEPGLAGDSSLPAVPAEGRGGAVGSSAGAVGRCLNFEDQLSPWEAGRRYRTPEILRMREGPDSTSAEVGSAIPQGSLVAVWEVSRHRTMSGGVGGPCAFVVVQDGPQQGHQGWVRCCSGRPVADAGQIGGLTLDEPKRSPPGQALSPAGAAGVACMPAVAMLQAGCQNFSSTACNEDPRSLNLNMSDFGTTEDKLVDEGSYLANDKDPCPISCCAPAMRLGAVQGATFSSKPSAAMPAAAATPVLFQTPAAREHLS